MSRPASPEPPASSETPKTHLLVVEDEPIIRELFSTLLQAAGYSVAQAEDGFSALEEVRRRRPALILSDLNMPRMTGFELLSVIRPPLSLRSRHRHERSLPRWRGPRRRSRRRLLPEVRPPHQHLGRGHRRPAPIQNRRPAAPSRHRSRPARQQAPRRPLGKPPRNPHRRPLHPAHLQRVPAFLPPTPPAKRPPCTSPKPSASSATPASATPCSIPPSPTIPATRRPRHR